MLYERLHFTFVGVLATLVDSIVVAEFAGYWLHRLLHSDRFPALSRGHLIHHFLIYGPRQPMRAGEYHDATENRFSIGNVGLEWLAPSGIILLFCWGVMALLGVPHVYQVIALCTLLGWPILMFSYLHDRMHLENFWMTRVPFCATVVSECPAAARHPSSQSWTALDTWTLTLASASTFLTGSFEQSRSGIGPLIGMATRPRSALWTGRNGSSFLTKLQSGVVSKERGTKQRRARLETRTVCRTVVL